MLINFGSILNKYNVVPFGIIHCGAHHCEEHDDYVSYGIKNFVYIEPCIKAFKIMYRKFSDTELDISSKSIFFGGKNIQLFNCACGVYEKNMVMYASDDNEGQSNSLLEPSLHLQQHPEIIFNDAEVVNVRRLDNLEIVKSDFNILAMDVQGFEGEVLKGATETLKYIDCIYTEVNNGETYKGNMLVDEMDKYLSEFTRVETYFPSPNWTWGDAIYIRKSLL